MTGRPPQTGGGTIEWLRPAGGGGRSGRRRREATAERPPRFFSSPACGGGREGAGGRAAPQSLAAPRDPPPTPPASGLLDSHIVFDAVSALYGAELVEAVEHDDGSGFSVISSPSSEAGADPGGEGEGAFWVGVFCFSVLPSSVVETASRAGRSSASKASWSGRRALPSRSWTICRQEMPATSVIAQSVLKGAVCMETLSISKPLDLIVRNSCSITQRRR